MAELTLALPGAMNPSGARSDEQLIGLWLHNRSVHTAKAYLGDVKRFLDFVGKPLGMVTVADVQAFDDSILNFADASRSREGTSC